jgi:hypothetical protein
LDWVRLNKFMTSPFLFINLFIFLKTSSWNYQPGSTESQDCLTAHVVSKISGGSIDQSCGGENAVLCQTHTSNVPHNPNYFENGPGTHISVVPLPGNNGNDNWKGSNGYSNIYSGPGGPIYGGFQIPPFPQYGHSYGIPPPLPPYGYPGGWKHKGNSHQCQANGATTVTVTEPGTAPTTVTIHDQEPVTVTQPGGDPVTIHDQEPVTVTQPGGDPVTITALDKTTVTIVQQEPVTITETGPAVTTVTYYEQEPIFITQPAAEGSTVTAIQQEHVTITEPAPDAVTITAPAPNPVTITEPAPITEPSTSTVTLPEQTITITEKGEVQTVTVPPITTTITIDVPETITVPTLLTVEAEPTTVTEHVTEHVTNVETETNKVTDYKTDTLTLTELTTETATEIVTKTNTVTDSFTEFMTQTEIKTLEPATVTLEASTVTLEPNTVTLDPETVTLGPNTITLPPNTVTLPPDTVTLPPNTVTLPPNTVTLEASTVTLPKDTQLITLPASTSVVYAVRDVSKTTTVYQQLPAQTLNRFITSTYTTTYLSVKMVTNTITSVTTSTLPAPPPVTVTQTIGQECSGSNDEFSSMDEWIFPFEINNFNGAGTYTLKNNGVLQVNAGGSYTFLSGGPPGGGPLSGSFVNHGGDNGSSNSGDSVAFVFSFDFPEFHGPGLYTRTNGVLSVLGDGSYTWLSGGPPQSGTGGFSYSFPFSVPGFRGVPGVFTLENGAVITVKNDGSYDFLSGTAPTGGSKGSGTTGGGVSYSFPFKVPGFKGSPGQFTLANGAVVTVKADGTYTILSGNAPNGAPNTGGGGNSYKYNLPFDVDNFSGPGTYTLSNGAVFTLKQDGVYSFLFGAPSNGAPVTGNAKAGSNSSSSSNGVSFSFPFNVPGFTGESGRYTLENNAVITVKNDGSYSFISGSAPQNQGSSGGSSGSSSSSSSSGISPGIYTLSNNAVISVRDDGSFTYLTNPANAPNVASQAGFNAFAFPAFARRSPTTAIAN